MEAELVVGALAMKEAVFFSNLRKIVRKSAARIDYTATPHAIGNRAYSSRTKHIALRFFYNRELVSEGKITINYSSTEDQLTDVGTKHLNKHRLQQHFHKIKNF